MKESPERKSLMKAAGSKKTLLMILALLFASIFFFPTVGYVIFSLLDHQMGERIQGRYDAVFFRPAFRIHDLKFNLPGKARVESGTVEVAYDPMTLISPSGIRLVLNAKELPVELAFAPLGQNLKKITLDQFHADVRLLNGELREIYSLEIVSPDLNLKLDASGRGS